MGKKKKKRGGRRQSSKDHDSFGAENSEVIADELTALCAIFQEDCKIAAGSPPQVDIKLRPYSKDTGYEDSDISALLLVRFPPGYPSKCPKLRIKPEKGLSEVDTDKLLTLLYDQANSNAREGRVMIYNLVEAAQEFLSEIVPQVHPCECFSRSHSTFPYMVIMDYNSSPWQSIIQPFVMWPNHLNGSLASSHSWHCWDT